MTRFRRGRSTAPRYIHIIWNGRKKSHYKISFNRAVYQGYGLPGPGGNVAIMSHDDDGGALLSSQVKEHVGEHP